MRPRGNALLIWSMLDCSLSKIGPIPTNVNEPRPISVMVHGIGGEDQRHGYQLMAVGFGNKELVDEPTVGEPAHCPELLVAFHGR